MLDSTDNSWFDWLEHGGVTRPSGFRAAGVAAGVKARGLDLALLVSESPAAAAGVFTTNRVVAAPVALDRARLAAGRVQAVVVNAGCANACTGEEGLADARRMTQLAAGALGLAEESVLVCSTGVIGRRLPMDRVATGIARAVEALSSKGDADAARAIMTTDTVPKQAALRVSLGGRTVTLGGMCKGAGMIDPRLATLLAFVTTDAAVAAADLRTALRQAVERSFNRISIDGDQSTNDTVLCLANGAAGNTVLDAAHPDWPRFVEALGALCERLARAIVADGEGATKFLTVTVEGAASADDALLAARSVARSLLFKTACHGGDPNWGRVLCAVGYSGAQVDDRHAQILFEDVCVYDRGTVGDAGQLRHLAEILGRPAFEVTVRLHLGTARDSVYTCDLSPEYVHINADYTT